MISTPRQMEALASPVRHQIHLAMEMLGSCTVNELAERLNRVPETLYYHIRRLEQVGLVEQVGSRASAGPDEAIYQLTARRLRIDPDQASPQFLAAMAKGCGALLRFALRTFEKALETRAHKRTGPRRELRIQQASVRLSARNLADLNRRLDSLEAFLNDADTPAADQSYLVTIAVSPIPDQES